MRRRFGKLLRSCALILPLAGMVATVPAARAQSTTFLIARLGMRNRATSHYNEVMHTHKGWTFPDVFWFDAGRSNYREIGFGFGRELLHTSHFAFTENGYFDQASGANAHSARFFVPWSQFLYTPHPKFRAEAVYFPELPLNDAGRIQHVFEREKAEYVLPHIKLGAGYGAYQTGDRAWQHKPFLTTTLRGGKLGELELWLQRLPGNHAQAQIRYKLAIQSPR